MLKSKDPCWVKYVNRTQYSINTSPHSAVDYKTPYRIIFGWEHVQGFKEFGIPDEIAEDVTTEEEMNHFRYFVQGDDFQISLYLVIS